MEPTGRREAPPDDRLRAIRDQPVRSSLPADYLMRRPGFPCAPSGLLVAGMSFAVAPQRSPGVGIMSPRQRGDAARVRPRLMPPAGLARAVAIPGERGSVKSLGMFAPYYRRRSCKRPTLAGAGRNSDCGFSPIPEFPALAKDEAVKSLVRYSATRCAAAPDFAALHPGDDLCDLD